MVRKEVCVVRVATADVVLVEHGLSDFQQSVVSAEQREHSGCIQTLQHVCLCSPACECSFHAWCGFTAVWNDPC